MIDQKKGELLSEIRKFAEVVFPDVQPNSHEFTSLKRTFIAGAMTIVEKLGNPDEGEAETMEWIEALHALGGEETSRTEAE